MVISFLLTQAFEKRGRDLHDRLVINCAEGFEQESLTMLLS